MKPRSVGALPCWAWVMPATVNGRCWNRLCGRGVLAAMSMARFEASKLNTGGCCGVCGLNDMLRIRLLKASPARSPEDCRPNENASNTVLSSADSSSMKSIRPQNRNCEVTSVAVVSLVTVTNCALAMITAFRVWLVMLKLASWPDWVWKV